ncbi:MAG TPA: hypothetical protein VKA46_36490 [Gemmataceae bacterium]|nr:hypothetical protein [Gemmataceae bacterium]
MARQAASVTEQLFFLHIPKTGGISLRNWLGDQFPAGRVCWIDHHDPRAAEGCDLDDSDLVGGHACYRLVERFARRPRVITFLREPIDRALSAFYFFRQLGRDGLVKEGASPSLLRACELSLADFIVREPREATLQLGSTQTWMLSQDQLGGFTDGPLQLGMADLKAATSNLARCEFIGLTERMDESIALLCRVMGWRARALSERANPTARRPGVADLDAPTRRLLEELTSLDQELYRFGVQLFEQRLRETPPAPSLLARLLARFRREREPALPLAGTLRWDPPAAGHSGPKGNVSGSVAASQGHAEGPDLTETAPGPR